MNTNEQKARKGLFWAAGTVLLIAALWIFGLVAPVLADGPHEEGVESSVEKISIGDAALLYLTDQAVMIDARPLWAYAQGHIDGALSLPLEDFDSIYPALKPRLKDDMTLITYCDGSECKLSGHVAEKLKEKGHENVRVLWNGWTLWKEAGKPTDEGFKP